MGDPSHKKEGHREITTHVSVHTLHLDGLRELYRHFLRLPDGAIVEVRLNLFLVVMVCCVKVYGASRSHSVVCPHFWPWVAYENCSNTSLDSQMALLSR